MLAACLQALDLLRVAEIGDVDFIELQITAAGSGECLYGAMIGSAEIGEEAGHLRIDMRVDGAPAAAEMQHAGRGDGLLRQGRTNLRRGVAEIVDEHRLTPCDRAGHAQRMLQRGAVELHLLLRHVHLHAVQTGEEVEVPIAATVFAVGRGAQADRLLAGDGAGDAAILDRAQRGGVERAGGAGGTCLAEFHGPQQAADMIGTKRRPRPRGERRGDGLRHGFLRCRGRVRCAVRALPRPVRPPSRLRSVSGARGRCAPHPRRRRRTPSRRRFRRSACRHRRR